jgi:hypothetical protein
MNSEYCLYHLPLKLGAVGCLSIELRKRSQLHLVSKKFSKKNYCDMCVKTVLDGSWGANNPLGSPHPDRLGHPTKKRDPLPPVGPTWPARPPGCCRMTSPPARPTSPPTCLDSFHRNPLGVLSCVIVEGVFKKDCCGQRYPIELSFCFAAADSPLYFIGSTFPFYQMLK